MQARQRSVNSAAGPVSVTPAPERLVGRYNTDNRIRAVRFIFIDPADAQRHLHEMWLRESRGLDLPVTPAWVQAVEASEL